MLVTSSIKGEGKTFISSNFAAFLSEKEKSNTNWFRFEKSSNS